MAYSLQNSKMYPANHKTVFVLDHTPYFGILSENLIEFEFLKGRTPSYIPMPPISKSLWTSSVESAIEYCRIVWDLFPMGKLVRFFVSDSVAHILNTWTPNQQSLTHIMNGCALIGVPPPPPPIRSTTPPPDYTVLHGLRAAIEGLCEPTEYQLEKIKSEGKILNRGRVICITSARDNESMKRLEEIFLTVLNQQNQIVTSQENLLSIDFCHLVIINTFPINVESSVNNHPPRALSSLLTAEVHSIKAPQIPNKLSSLILDHYELASTTVTGIPMKEEQNAKSSANYDVEIFHSNLTHTAFLKGNIFDSADIKTTKDGFEYETVTLRWCTPKGAPGPPGPELQNCTAMHRITPVDVNSRPSLCLINFLLNGRSVMLEMPRKSGKITSHLLAAHSGEIFIHTLCTARSVLEDPPSVSEGCGGRVTDYRIPDFCSFIKRNTLIPIKRKSVDGDKNLDKVKDRLFRQTKFWPMTINSTLIFNLKQHLEPLLSLFAKDEMTEDELMKCRQVIYNLISDESKLEPLHLQYSGHRCKGQKKEDQYKAVWNELEVFMKNNLHSENHKLAYQCLLECHKFNFENIKVDNDKVDLQDALNQLDNMSSTRDENLQRASVIRATTDSPMSPPCMPNIPQFLRQNSKRSSVYNTHKTLFEIFTLQEKGKSRPEFAGRLGGSLVAKLYPNLKVEDRTERSMEVE